MKKQVKESVYDREIKWLETELAKRELNVPQRAKEFYAQTFAIYDEAFSRIQAEGVLIETEYGLRPHPAVRIMDMNRESCLRQLKEFSLTPLSAAKLARRIEGQNPIADYHSEGR